MQIAKQKIQLFRVIYKKGGRHFDEYRFSAKSQMIWIEYQIEVDSFAVPDLAVPHVEHGSNLVGRKKMEGTFKVFETRDG